VAGAATGVGEADDLLGASRVSPGDVVLAMASSGLHSNGFSLVRKIVSDAGWSWGDYRDDFGRSVGLELLEPTRLYTRALVEAFMVHPGAIHSVSHVTGGGIAQNLSRVLPPGVVVDVDRSTWSLAPVFQVLSDVGGFRPTDVEDTWNMGIGMLVVVDSESAQAIAMSLRSSGHTVWQVGDVRTASAGDSDGAVTEAKGVSGGAVRLVGSYSSLSSA
jgi:phosphoribosylformylglycinamidine cyclo-ligase